MHCDTLHYWPPSCRRIRTGSGGGVVLSLRAEWHVTHGFGNMALARPACAVHVMPGCLRAGRGLERDRPPLHTLLVSVARLTVGALLDDPCLWARCSRITGRSQIGRWLTRVGTDDLLLDHVSCVCVCVVVVVCVMLCSTVCRLARLSHLPRPRPPGARGKSPCK